jgi:hypothetical protein
MLSKGLEIQLLPEAFHLSLESCCHRAIQPRLPVSVMRFRVKVVSDGSRRREPGASWCCPHGCQAMSPRLIVTGNRDDPGNPLVLDGDAIDPQPATRWRSAQVAAGCRAAVGRSGVGGGDRSQRWRALRRAQQ